eukprot:339961_1
MAALGAITPLPEQVIALDRNRKVKAIPRNTASVWAYLAFLAKDEMEMNPETVAEYREFCTQWERVSEKNCHSKSSIQLKNLYYLLTSDEKFDFA